MDWISKAKNAIDDTAAGLMGDIWVAEVKGESGQWKNLDGWKDQYEPKQPTTEDTSESEEPTAASNQALNSAIEFAFAKIEESLVFDIMKIMLEVSSLILGMMYEKIGRNDPTASPLEVINAFNAVILSYRFDTTGTGSNGKFKHIRKQACLGLTNTVYDLYERNKTPAQVASELCALFGTQKHNIRALLMSKIDEMMGMASTKLEEQIGGTNDHLENAKSLLAQGQDNILAQFTSFMLVSRLEVVDVYLQTYTFELLAIIDKDMSMTGGKQKSKQEVAARVFEFVEKEFEEARHTLSSKVQGVTNFLKGMIINSPGEVGCGGAQLASPVE